MVLAPDLEGAEAFDAKQPFDIYRWNGFLRDALLIKRVFQVVFPLYSAFAIYRRRGFDLIECGQALPFGLIALFFQWLFGVPYIVWVHGNDVLKPQRYPLLRQLLSLILRKAKAIVANSKTIGQTVVKLGVDAEKVVVVNPSVDAKRFHPQIDSTEIVTRYGLQGKKVILTVGRLVERKGMDTVIKSMPKIMESIPNVVYLIVGEGNYRSELERLVKELGLNGKVIFAGRVAEEDLPKFYNACDLFVMVSRTLEDKGEIEGFGIAYLEAGACGKPVIGGKTGGISDAIEDGVTGLLVDPLDTEEVTDSIVKLLKDEALAKELGRNGRKRAIREPGWALLTHI